jgi:hypothetical protein
MNTNAIDTEKATTPEPGVPQAKGKRAPAKKAKPAKKAGRAKKPSSKPKTGPRQQEGQSDRHDEARQRRDAGRDHSHHKVASTYSPGLRQHTGQ